ncbi:agmatine deiminase family protein [Pseudomonas sp. 6D_7.1_Bac1]|nr:agmatine deiminase family protein [Pseudomonas sp. 6D_7.1_Bac1]MCU1748790.1 agmatine deiminase family protein [Pseudomonas sp. 6D_7.1_Bac1]
MQWSVHLWAQYAAAMTCHDFSASTAKVNASYAVYGPSSVAMVVHPDDMFCAERFCEPTIKLIPLSVNDSWCRDTGPAFICHTKHGVAGINWGINGWGGKAKHELDATLGRRILENQGLECLVVPLINEGGAIHVDGEGTLITTESVLPNANRNHGMDKLEVEEYFRLCLGIEKTIWLPGDPNDATDDITDGHVDGICAFAHPGGCCLSPLANRRLPTPKCFVRIAAPSNWREMHGAESLN